MPVPRPHIAMRNIREALRLSQSLSVRQVAASLQLPHTTVADHLRRAKAAGLSWPLPEGLGDGAIEALLFVTPAAPAQPRPVPDWEQVHKELRRKGVTLMLLWYEYRQEHPDGWSYSQFTDRYRQWRRHLDATMRQEHKAGERLFVDFPGETVPVYEALTGQVAFQAEIFVAVMGASSYVYAEAFPSQELIYWVTAHVHAFEALGGCPELVVCDNLRSGVSRAHRYEPGINATFQEMAAHYGVAILPGRPYKARDKAKAEVGVLLVERWVVARLRKQRFTSLGELNAAITELVAWLNARPFKRLSGSRQSLFEELDRPVLRPLPPTRYEFATWRHARLGPDYHVELRAERHFYSAPHTLIGQVLDVRASASTVEVFYRGERVASHPRSYTPGYTTDPAHMPEAHRRHAYWTPERIVSWAEKTGPATARFAEALISSRPHPQQGFRACLGVVRLSERYGKDRVEAACERALALRSYSYRSVEPMLRHGLDRLSLAEQLPLPVHPRHENLRGGSYYS
jgi:transposase